MVLIFLNKKKKKLRFWVHPILRERQQQEGFHGFLQMSVWQFGGGGSTSEEGETKLIDPEQILAVSEVRQW